MIWRFPTKFVDKCFERCENIWAAMHRFKARVAGLLLLCSMLLVTTLLYFLLFFDDQSPKKFPQKIRRTPLILYNFEQHRPNNDSLEEAFEKRIKQNLRAVLERPYKDIDPESDTILRTLKNSLIRRSVEERKSVPELIKVAKSWIRARQIVPEKADELGDILYSLQTSPIISSDVYRQGTQLKLLITMADGLQAVVKPQRYSRDDIEQNSHSGKDRHNGEIVSFHVARLLGLRVNPIVGSRILMVESEIKNRSTESLRKTFLDQRNQIDVDVDSNGENRDNMNDNGDKNDNGNGDVDQEQSLCFYGECYYCNEYDPVCPDPATGTLEAAIILLLPSQYKVESIKNPWQRTYSRSLLAKWQTDDHYCLAVKKSVTEERLLDMIDSAIFDFIVGNSDRHHHQVWKDVQNSALLMIDNGKSFANPQIDELSILFPLLQCCLVRQRMFERLRYLSNHRSSDLLSYLLSDDILWPLLNDQHFQAIDRRIRIVLQSIAVCRNQSMGNVLVKF